MIQVVRDSIAILVYSLTPAVPICLTDEVCGGKIPVRIWKAKDISKVPDCAVAGGQMVYHAARDGRICALDPDTGKEQWRFKASARILTLTVLSGTSLIVSSTTWWS